MREHDSILFLGNGEHSLRAESRLHMRYREAFSQLSAWQQGSRPTAEDIQEMDDVVRDIAAALLGREIELGAELPYPGKIRHKLAG